MYSRRNRFWLALVLCLLGVVPVIADVLVGVTDNGTLSTAITDAVCTRRTALATGTATVIRSRTGNDFGDSTWVMAVYLAGMTHPTGDPLFQSTAATAVTLADTVYDSNGLTCATDCAVTASTDYFLCFWSNDADVEASYDTGAANQVSYTAGDTYPNWPTWSDTNSINRQYDVWVEGTLAGGASGSMLLGRIGK